MDVIRYKPQAIVTFHTETGNLVARATSDPNSKIDDDIVNIRTTRDMGADAPTFSINLTRRKQWHKWITSNDMVSIVMHRPPEAQATVFVGLVDDCRKRVAVSSNSVQRVVTVTGRGAAKAFIQFDIGIVPEAEYHHVDIGWLVSNGVTLAGSSPKKIMTDVWERIAKEHVNYKWDNGKTLFGEIQHNLAERPNMILLDDSGMVQHQGSLWALLKSLAEEPFYELFWEIEGSKPTMILRPTPFNSGDWGALPISYITDKEVVTDELGRSDVETYTLFSVGAKSFFSPADSYKTYGSMPLWYKPYYNKYGIRRLQVESSYLAVAESSDVSAVDLMKLLQVDLYNWNIKNNSMFNGTIIVKGSNRYKVGTRLSYTSAEDGSTIEYYIRSVNQNFTNFGTWVTELGVIRGLNSAERFTSPVGSHTEYSGSGLTAFNPGLAQEAIKNGEVALAPISGDYTGKAQDVIDLAMHLDANGVNGIPIKYTFGAESVSTGRLDCSSFTQHVYGAAANMKIGRTTGDQVTKGTKVEKSQLEPGDLVFFKNTYASSHIHGVSHVGIYMGGGQFIHNGSSNSVGVSSLMESYWQQHWLMGRRVLQPEANTATGSNFSATAYGATALNLGAGPDYVPTGETKTGTVPSEGRTIAVDPLVIPLNSRVRIESSYPGITGEYIAEDIGSAIKGNRIDIYFNDLPPYDNKKARVRMLDFGKRNVKVTILERGD